LTPFFFTPSVGGSINDGTGVPFGIGVLDVDSVGFSSFELGTTIGTGLEIVDDDSFDGDSSLTTCLSSAFTGAAGSNLCSTLGDTFRVTIMLPFDDFRRALEAVGVLVDEAIMD